ncbi:MAG: GNAT family N-acetyltransferase [Flavisolibacter sp.]
MDIKVTKTTLKEIEELRELFLHEGNFQFVHNKCHEYNWCDDYLILVDGIKAGYGAVWGKDKREDRDTIFEFYLIEPYRKFSSIIFKELITISKATYIDCQTNDSLLALMQYEYSKDIHTEAILFKDEHSTYFSIAPNIVFEKSKVAPDHPAGSGEYLLKKEGTVVATGGFLMNYNYPYADIYYDVKEEFRRMGFGTLMVQELKKEVYLRGRVPAARCNIKNHASRGTLLKGGFVICGYWLQGSIS